jgi:arylsulfatase
MVVEAGASRNAQGKPNVLLICVEHWSGRLLGAAGHPSVLTPTLDQLAANGVRYTNAYSAVPVCIAARRALMTGTTPQTHGDRCFNETLEMPEFPTLAQTFYDAGYQTYAVGKLHVYPQRDRIGFGDVILNEEGRHHLGLKADDYELFLAAEGYAGQEFAHGMCNNDYMTRPWHLPEYLHATNWTVHEMCSTIKRRDPTRPALWYMSFNFPHPPLVPLAEYLDLYREVKISDPFVGGWAREFERLPYALQKKRHRWAGLRSVELKSARRAFYALCTHIDHQIRLVIGTLREEGLLDNTIIGFTADHGEMLGNHGLFAKGLFYEDSAKVPLILVPTAEYAELGHHRVDGRLAELRDVMPTLLEMAGMPVPDTVEGISLLSDSRRDELYGEYEEGDTATRMLRDDRYKLIFYPVGNRLQLFDLLEDPDELNDLACDPSHSVVREELTRRMIPHFYGGDLDWIENGELAGLPDKPYEPEPDRTLNAQRGWRFM